MQHSTQADETVRDAASEAPWSRVSAQLDALGFAVVPNLLSRDDCARAIESYGTEIFRKRVAMVSHGFGRGEYKYFAYPLPAAVAELRARLYPPLACDANRWQEAIGDPVRYPAVLDEFLARCHAAGQRRPTPLLLAYGEGDYNCLHQDVYGEHVFPLQATVLLSQPGDDFEGGEFVLSEQRPRMQSRAHVVPLRRGDAVVFAVNRRPVRGTRGTYRVTLRHGVATIRSGRRYALGLIFHDAR